MRILRTVATWCMALCLLSIGFGPGAVMADNSNGDEQQLGILLMQMAAVVERNDDDQMVLTALKILTQAEYPEVLPAARRCAMSGATPEIRQAAIRLLGWHGAPRDWELILIGLSSKDQTDVLASIWALEKFGDVRGLNYLDDLAKDQRGEVAAAARLAAENLRLFVSLIKQGPPPMTPDGVFRVLIQWLSSDEPWTESRHRAMVVFSAMLSRQHILELRRLSFWVREHGVQDADRRANTVGDMIRAIRTRPQPAPSVGGS